MTRSASRSRLGVSIVIACANVCLLQSGCARDARSGTRYQRALDRLASLEAAARSREVPREALNDRAANECKSIMLEFDSPRELHTLFLECNRRSMILGAECSATQELDLVDPYRFAYESALCRLRDIKSPEAIGVLIALHESEAFSSQAATSEALIELLRMCGTPALDQLKALRRRRPKDEAVNWIIQGIEEDEAEKRGRKRNID